MQEPTNKETFHLLQLSDESKSLSDLELPEVTAQRKRKVRRKTRPRPSSTHRQAEDVTSESQCNKLIICIAIFLTSCWLLTLSYMLAVIHAESTRLEVQIKNMAMTSQNVPDALQKWHETSKTLEQNQTAINIKMLELQHMIDELRTRITLYQTQLNEKKDYSKEGKFVADFGAEIRAVSTDMEHIKDRLATFQTDQNTFRNDVDMLKGNFSEAIMNATRRANNNETNYSDEMKKSQTIVLDEIKSLSANLSLINDTLSQEAKILSADQTLQRNQLEKISEKTDNISSHVDSIEMKWTENKHLLSDLDTFKNNSNYEIQSLRNVTYDLKYALENMQKIALQSSSRDKTIKLEEKPYRNEDPPKTESTENNNMKTSTSTNAMVVPPLSTMSTKPVTTAATTVNQTNTTTGSNTTAVVNATVAAAAVEGKPKLLSIPISKIR